MPVPAGEEPGKVPVPAGGPAAAPGAPAVVVPGGAAPAGGMDYQAPIAKSNAMCVCIIGALLIFIVACLTFLIGHTGPG